MAAHRQHCGQDQAGKEEPGSPLSRAVRAHANFAEYTPLSFLLLFLAELNGAPTKYVHAAYVTLFVTRVSAGLGLQLGKCEHALRAFGFLGTLSVMLGAGLYNVRRAALTQFGLGFEPLKSFLGIQ